MHIEIAIVGVEFASPPESSEFKAEAIAEHIGKQQGREEELMSGRLPRVARRVGDQRAACDDEMDVQMLLQSLPPGVHDHSKTDVAAEILLTELLQQLSRDINEEIEEEFLIESNQVIEDMINGEDDMEIMNGQDPFLLIFEPLCFLKSPTLGTMAILSSFVVELPIETVGTHGHNPAESGRAAI